MSAALLERVVIPLASEDDARATMRATAPYLESAGGTATLVFVLEKAGGAPDKASVEQREGYANEVFDVARDVAADSDVPIETRIEYGTDVGETIVGAANDVDASAIVFTPRGGSRWVKLLTGDVTRTLLTESDLPVITLPEASDG